MLLNDGMVPLRGEVVLRVLDLTGKCVAKYHDKNTITYMAPVVLMDLLTQTDFDNTGLDIGTSHPLDLTRGFVAAEATVPDPQHNTIRYMRVGTGNGQAVRGEFALNSPVADANGGALVSSASFPANAAVTFVALFGSDVANVVDPIQEVSLWTRGSASSLVEGDANSRMFARQAHPPVTKTSAIQLEYTWTIYFT